MKKVLVLLLIFALASVASAALQISVNGDKDPTESEWGILPSQELVLDIWTDSDITPGVGEGWWALVANPVDATISGGAAQLAEPGLGIYPGPVPAANPNGGVYGLIALSTLPTIAADTTIYDGIIFHCNSDQDVVVTLLFGAGIGAWTPVDTAIIHQPEPMTIALLGLGGLFLRRRK